MERIFNNVKITSSFEKSETRENLVSGETIGQHFGKIAKVIDDLENGEFNCNLTIDNALSETSENPVQNKVVKTELDKKANKNEIPTELPANGGNADTVGGHTVKADVPANAVFTDTTYEPATSSTDGLMSVADKKKLDSLSGSGGKDFLKYYQSFSDLFRLI